MKVYEDYNNYYASCVCICKPNVERKLCDTNDSDTGGQYFGQVAGINSNSEPHT